MCILQPAQKRTYLGGKIYRMSSKNASNYVWATVSSSLSVIGFLNWIANMCLRDFESELLS